MFTSLYKGGQVCIFHSNIPNYGTSYLGTIACCVNFKVRPVEKKINMTLPLITTIFTIQYTVQKGNSSQRYPVTRTGFQYVSIK